MVFRHPSSDIAQSRLWSNFSSAYFVPLSDIEHFTERSRISHVLDQVFPLQLDRDILVERILALATRLYCILLYIGQIDSLQTFLAIDFSDSKLPLSDETVLSDLQAVIDWNRDLLDRFLEAQWLFFAPCFKLASSNLSLLPNMPLPFVYEATGAKIIARSSTIVPIQIHEAHQNIFKPNGIPRPVMALKSFQASKKSRFKKELRVLQVLNQGHSKHIVKLIASFSSCNSHGLLFAWGEMNLREFFGQKMSPGEEPEMETWILSQMTGLAQGLSIIHQSTDHHDGTVVYGRHSDLHPLNILLVSILDDPNFDAKGTLQLSSFGEAYFFHSPEDFNIPRDTGMYEAPECQLERTAGPSYDVWSLGCIFLEILVWLSEGPQGLQRFALARINPDPVYGDIAFDDYFFTLQAKEKTYVSAEVRPSVKEWIERCVNHWEAGSAFREVISIIEEHMLQPYPDRRLASKSIYSKLRNLCNNAGRAGMQYGAPPLETQEELS